jgi:ribosomal protein L20A (L18A)
MVKEFRALSRAEAVESMYQDMAARHRARFRNVQILRVAEIEKKEDVRRPYIKQLLEPGLKFPLPHRRTTSKAWYAAGRPVCSYYSLGSANANDRLLGLRLDRLLKITTGLGNRSNRSHREMNLCFYDTCIIGSALHCGCVAQCVSSVEDGSVHPSVIDQQEVKVAQSRLWVGGRCVACFIWMFFPVLPINVLDRSHQ